MPAVSVLLPARDAAPTLPAALGSLLRQSFTDLEIVLVDDGSSDATAAFLREIAPHEPRLRVLEGPGRGIVAALELGRAACRAPLIARMDADDVAHPRRLERQVAALAAEPTLAGVGCAVTIFPPPMEGMRLYARWLAGLVSPEQIHRERFVESPLVHPAVLLRAGPLAAAGGWVERGVPEDYDLWLTMLARGERLANLPARLLFWRDHPGRLTRTDPRYGKRAHLALKARHLAAGPLAGSARCGIWGAGRTGTALARALEPHGIRPAFFVDVDRNKIGRRRREAPILAPDALPPPGATPLLVAVAFRGARALVRAHLDERGWREGVDYLCVA